MIGIFMYDALTQTQRNQKKKKKNVQNCLIYFWRGCCWFELLEPNIQKQQIIIYHDQRYACMGKIAGGWRSSKYYGKKREWIQKQICSGPRSYNIMTSHRIVIVIDGCYRVCPRRTLFAIVIVCVQVLSHFFFLSFSLLRKKKREILYAWAQYA